MADINTCDPSFSPIYRLSSVRFNTFTADEIKKISCKRITNPETFDALLHPNPGGLHDPALGPSDKQELCGTCGLNYIHCPGHIGHIVLPLTVFHPIFFQSLYKIFRSSCFVCNRFVSTLHQAQLIKGQIALLDKGLVSEALELELNIGKSSLDGDKQDDITAVIEKTHSYVQSCLEQASACTDTSKTKHLTDLRRTFIDTFFHSLNTTKCPHCNAPIRKIRQEFQIKVMMRGLSPKLAALWKASVMKYAQSSAETTTLRHLIDVCKEQHFLTPLEARDHLRALWSNEPLLLTSLFSCLKNENNVIDHNKYPVDMFFVDIVAVPPSRFRPVCHYYYYCCCLLLLLLSDIICWFNSLREQSNY